MPTQQNKQLLKKNCLIGNVFNLSMVVILPDILHFILNNLFYEDRHIVG